MPSIMLSLSCLVQDDSVAFASRDHTAYLNPGFLGLASLDVPLDELVKSYEQILEKLLVALSDALSQKLSDPVAISIALGSTPSNDGPVASLPTDFR